MVFICPIILSLIQCKSLLLGDRTFCIGISKIWTLFLVFWGFLLLVLLPITLGRSVLGGDLDYALYDIVFAGDCYKLGETILLMLKSSGDLPCLFGYVYDYPNDCVHPLVVVVAPGELDILLACEFNSMLAPPPADESTWRLIYLFRSSTSLMISPSFPRLYLFIFILWIPLLINFFFKKSSKRWFPFIFVFGSLTQENYTVCCLILLNLKNICKNAAFRLILVNFFPKLSQW